MISDSVKSRFGGSRYLLLTGATGFLGRYLLRDLLLEGERVAVIVRPTSKETAQQRIEKLLAEWEEELGKLLPRPVVLSGNLAEPDCGLTSDSLRWVANHCSRVLHSAAVLRFHASNHQEEPWRTNVGGTQNIIKLCEQSNIREFHSVSTAYVCGDRTELILEDELEMGQSFRNDYEKSKFEAEKLIREATCFDSVTIYRPAVISGDSTNGFTSSYHGLYVYLRLMSILVPAVEPDEDGVRHTDMILPMSGDEPRNIVPVDWVAEVICHLLNQPESHGRTYHLAPDKKITPRRVVEYGYSYFNSTGVRYCEATSCSHAVGSDFETKFLENIREYEPYDQSDPNFDRSNLLKFAPHLPCPEISEQVLHRYIAFGEAQRWGKKRSKKHVPVSDVHNHLQHLCFTQQTVFSIDDLRLRSDNSGKSVTTSSRNGEVTEESCVLGLDLMGQGGGQWHLIGNPDNGYVVRPGLPVNQAPLLHLTTDEFRKLIHHQEESARPYFRNLHESADMEQYDRIVSGVLHSIISTPL